jgi:hypothetical protein
MSLGSLGDIFAKYSRMLLILALLPWQLNGPAYFHMHDRLRKRGENDCVWLLRGLLAVCFGDAFSEFHD